MNVVMMWYCFASILHLGAAASTDCFLFNSTFGSFSFGFRLCGERHPDHNGGVPSSLLLSFKLICGETPLATVTLLPLC